MKDAGEDEDTGQGDASNNDTVVRLVQVENALALLNTTVCSGASSPVTGDDNTTEIAFHERGANDEDGPWTKCEGMKVEDCLFFIRETGFRGKVVKVEKDSAVDTREYDDNRVRIYYDDGDIVQNVPFIG